MDIKSIFSSYKGQSGWVAGRKDIGAIERYNKMIEDNLKPTADYIDRLFQNGNQNIAEYVKSLDGAKVKTQQFGSATVVGATGLKGMATAAKLVGKELLLAAGQFAIFMAATWAISKAWEVANEWFYQNVDTLSNLKGRLEDANAELKETQDNIESLNGELETTEKRITELEAKGSLTLTEQNELKQLRLENTELEKRIALLREEEEIKKRAQAEAGYDLVSKYNNRDPIINLSGDETDRDARFANASYGTLDQQLNNYIDLYNEVQSEIDGLIQSDDDYLEKLDKLKEELVKYEKYIVHLSGVIIDNPIDPKYLSDPDQKRQVELNNKASNLALVTTGVMSINDFIQASLGSTDYDEYVKKMQELADAGVTAPEEVEAAFAKSMPEVLTLMNELGFGAEGLAKEISSLRNVGDVVEQVIGNNSAFSDVQSKIEEITSSDFEITTDSITEAVGQDFVTALDKAGISISDFCNWLSSMQNAVEEISVKDTVKELSGIEEKLNSLSDAYYEFVDNAGKVDAKTLDGFAETFADISDTDAYADFIKTIGNSSSTVSQLQTALDELVTTYFRQESTVEDLNEDTLQLYAAQLKQMGVVNALEVAQHELNLRTIESAEYTDDEVDALYDAVVGLKLTGDAAEDTAIKLALFESYQEYIANNNFAEVCESHGKSILKVAEAAGASAPILAKYLKVMSAIEEFQQRVATYGTSAYVGGAGLYYKGLLDEAAGLAEQAEAEYKSIFTGGVQVKFTPTKDKDKSGGDKGDPEKEEYDKEKKRLDNLLERNKISYRKYYKDLKDLGNEHFKKGSANMREHYATLADVRRDAYAKYQGDLDKDLANGLISLQTYYDKSKALSKEWLDGRKANEEDYKEAVEAIYDAVNDAWGDRISKMEQQMERWTLDKTWDPGVTEADIWKRELEALDKDYKNGLFDSEKDYFDKRYDLLEKYQDALKESYEEELDLIEDQKDSIQDLVDLVSDMMKHELEEQIDALEKQKDLYSEIVDEKKKSLDLTREENEYHKQLEEYNRDLTELQAKAAVLALDDSREGRAQYAAIMEQIREKQNEIQSSQSDHTYDATTEALDAAQSAYEEKIEKQVSDIQALMEEAGPWLERVYERIEQTPPSKLLADLTRYNYYQGTGMDSDVKRIWAASEDLLTEFKSDIPAILTALENREKDAQDKVDAAGGGKDATPSGNHTDRISTELNKQIQASVTENNKHATNRGLVTQLKEETGLDSWYDEKNKVIYIGSEGDRRVTAGAYNVIQKMREVNDSSLSVKEKEKKLNDLLDTLQRKWSYEYSYLEEANGKFHLYKKSKEKSAPIQVFHSGYARGYVGESTPSYTPDAKQRELLALLEAGELVVNKTQQGYLLSQLQTLQTLSDGLRKLQLDSVPGDTYGVGEINIEVNAPITITGSADADTIKELEKFKKNLSNDVLGEVTSAMKRKGYGRNTAVNARKK